MWFNYFYQICDAFDYKKTSWFQKIYVAHLWNMVNLSLQGFILLGTEYALIQGPSSLLITSLMVWLALTSMSA